MLVVVVLLLFVHEGLKSFLVCVCQHKVERLLTNSTMLEYITIGNIAHQMIPIVRWSLVDGGDIAMLTLQIF
jgi:hypothetical protein